MTKPKKLWYLILFIYLIPLLLHPSVHSKEIIWLIYIIPSVWLPFYYGLKGGLTATFAGMILHSINEVIEIFLKGNDYQIGNIWDTTIIALVNITVAITIGRLVDKLKSEQHSLEKAITKMEYMAYHDYLTGLPNRWNFELKLRKTLEEQNPEKDISAVIFIDLDRFKLINDSLGHAVGDKLLKDVSKRIQNILRKNECLARQGGDEFIFFISNCSTKKEIEDRVLELHRIIQEPLKLQKQEFYISSSIGISLYPNNSQSWEKLIQQADIAMYSAKEKGGNRFEFYNSAKQQEIHDMVKIETHLRKAMQSDEFTLYYQPFVDLTSGKILGVEALVRWKNPELGVVPPTDFIPLAEEIGIIPQLGEWVLREACHKAIKISKILQEPVRIAVNISSKQFKDENFVAIVQQVLLETLLPPSQLELEITESVSLEEIDGIILKLNALRSMGIGISIDDFGTGYSSISYLKYLPINTLKIDQSFIQNMLYNLKDRALVESIISLSKNFGFNVIAEGVETKEQLELLKSYSCNQAQGYLFSKPVPLKELYHLLEENKKLTFQMEYVS